MMQELIMPVSSRTPEGFPSRCPLCGAQTKMEFSDPKMPMTIDC